MKQKYGRYPRGFDDVERWKELSSRERPMPRETVRALYENEEISERFARQSMELMHGVVHADPLRIALRCVLLIAAIGLTRLLSGRVPEYVMFPVLLALICLVLIRTFRDLKWRLEYNRPKGCITYRTLSGGTTVYPLSALMDYEMEFHRPGLMQRLFGGILDPLGQFVPSTALVIHLPDGSSIRMTVSEFGGCAGAAEFRRFLDLYRQYVYDPEALPLPEQMPAPEVNPVPKAKPAPVKQPKPAKQPEPVKLPEPVFTERPVMPERSNGAFPDPTASFPDPVMSFPDPAGAFPDPAQPFPDPAQKPDEFRP